MLKCNFFIYFFIFRKHLLLDIINPQPRINLKSIGENYSNGNDSENGKENYGKRVIKNLPVIDFKM